MKNSGHALCCGIGTIPVMILNFVLGNPRGGWAILVLAVVIFIIAAILYLEERRTDNGTRTE